MKIIILAIIIYKVLDFIWIYLRPSSIRKYLRKDTYALITGSTDGIGKAIAMELAGKGFNIILHGRNKEKLAIVKEEIKNLYPEIIVADILHDGSKQGRLQIDYPVAVLVNNVGTGPIAALENTEIDATINLNVLFPTHLTQHLLPHLSRPALILNVSSYAGLYPPPYLSVYAATKAYNNAFSKSLSVELDNVETISLITGSVHSASNQQPVTFMRPDSAAYAKHVLSVVGCGKKSVYPYWPHAVQTYILSLLPDKTVKKFISGLRQDSGIK